MKHLPVFFVASVLLTGCFEDCPNEVSRDLTETDLAWFACEPGDTVFYKDAESEEMYYLVCDSCKTGEIRYFRFDTHCKNEGFYDIRKTIHAQFSSDLPHYLDDLTNIYIDFETLGPSTSIVYFRYMGFTGPTYTYGLDFSFKPDNESVERIGGTSKISHLESIEINGRLYTNVFILVFLTYDDERSNAFYDTLYYNRDGFLKFISSKYGYRLERME